MKWRLVPLLILCPLIVEAASAVRKAEVNLSEGLLAFRDEHYELAERHFSDAIANDPENPPAFFYRALSCCSPESRCTKPRD